MAVTEASGFPPAPALVTAVEESGFSPPPAPVAVEIAAPTDQEEMSSKLNQTIEKLQADLAISTHKIAELERAKSDAERALEEADQATRAAENAKQEVEQARRAEKRTSDTLIAQLRTDRVAAGAKTSRWEIALYGSIGGVLVVLTSSAIGFLINGGSASAPKPVEKRRRKPIEVPGSTLSPEIAISEAALERDLEQAVAGINGVPTALGTDRRYERFPA
jgi:type IV secretory pathway VirB10-like protein